MNNLSPYGEGCGRADFKTLPEDFQVFEVPSFTPSGHGEHLWLKIKKTNTNTAWVAEQLAKQSAIKLRDVSYAGRKDKFAVTEQWFSLYDPKRIADSVSFNILNCTILESIRHVQKLRVGNLQGNKFIIRLRNFEGDIQCLRKRIDLIKCAGFANYFGAQRFGKRQSNVVRAKKWVSEGAGRLKKDQRSLYLSTLRSYLFNQILSTRVKQGNWNTLLDGELAQLAGSNSLLLVDKTKSDYVDLVSRCGHLDVHPTGPLIGSGEFAPNKEAIEIENVVLSQYKELQVFLERETNNSRRSLRALPSEVFLKKDNSDVLLSFYLDAGTYASVFLQHLLEYDDLSVKRS